MAFLVTRITSSQSELKFVPCIISDVIADSANLSGSYSVGDNDAVVYSIFNIILFPKEVYSHGLRSGVLKNMQVQSIG